MPTPTDLRRALDQLGSEAPSPLRTRTAVLSRIEPGPGRSRRTRLHRPLLVAAAMLVLVLVVLTGLVHDDLARPVVAPTTGPAPLGPPPPATELRWTFDVPHPPPGTKFRRFSIAANQQTGMITRTDDTADVQITVHAPGTFDPLRELSSRRRVVVTGQGGYWGPVQGSRAASLVWPTPAGGWAQLYGFGVVGPDRSEAAADPTHVLAEQLALAPLVRLDRSGSPRLPFRLGWLPPGLSVQGVAVDDTLGSAIFSDAGPVTLGVGTLAVSRVDTSATSFSAAVDDVVGADRESLTVDGHQAVRGRARDLDARVLAVDLGDGSTFLVYVARTQVDRYPDEVTRRILEGADVSPAMGDTTSWVPAQEAVRA